MSEPLQFATREDFRRWLAENVHSSGGVWLLFGKAGGPKTLKASEALKEALCFGWIDGQMKSIDERSYIKYFSLRRANSKWSAKNKALAQKLKEQGVMSAYGLEKITDARNNGQWDAARAPAITEEEIAFLITLLRPHETACANFLAMPPSVKKTYTRAYFDAKTNDGRASRLAWMLERLNKNLKPM